MIAETEIELRTAIEIHLTGLSESWSKSHEAIAENLKRSEQHLPVTPAMEQEEQDASSQWRRHWNWLHDRGIVDAEHLTLRDGKWVARDGIDLYTVVISARNAR